MRFLGYAIEKVDLKPPATMLSNECWTIDFQPFGTTKRFADYDGVILFQGSFEEFVYHEGAPYGLSDSYWTCKVNEDELHRRFRELGLLGESGGVACFLLTRPFHDRRGRRDFKDTDLAKLVLNASEVQRRDYASRSPSVTSTRDELRRFLSIFGAASSHFNAPGLHDYRAIARCGLDDVGFALGADLFFVPSLPPRSDSESLRDYFTILIEGLIATHIRLSQEAPPWVDEFELHGERALADERDELLQNIAEKEERLRELRRFKAVLGLDSDRLVEAAKGLIENGLGITVTQPEGFREDLQIIDQSGTPVVLLEIKGTKGGLKREAVNQADSHRERSGVAPDFPTVLVVNTLTGSTYTLQDKDQPLASENVAHARKNGVLVLRTLDLLRLLDLVRKGSLAPERVLEILRTQSGWLRVVGDSWSVEPGQSVSD